MKHKPEPPRDVTAALKPGIIFGAIAILLLSQPWTIFRLPGCFFVFLAVTSTSLLLLLPPVGPPGHAAERQVARLLTRLPDGFRILNDLTIAVGQHQAQIDHVIVSPYGLWCVETKSHVGTVLGREQERNWTQVKYTGRRKCNIRLYSPVRQNQVHCQRLSQLLQDRFSLQVPIHSVVVFTAARLHVETDTPVVKPPDLLQAIAASAGAAILTEQQLDGVVRLLHPEATPDAKAPAA